MLTTEDEDQSLMDLVNDRCVRCNRPRELWIGPGYLRDGEEYCCERCAARTGCLCEENDDDETVFDDEMAVVSSSTKVGKRTHESTKPQRRRPSR